MSVRYPRAFGDHRLWTAALSATLAMTGACGSDDGNGATAGSDAGSNASSDAGSDAGAGGGGAASLQSIAKASKDGIEVELLAAAALRTGYQPVALRVTQDSKAVTKAAISLRPLMKMMSKSHGCPVVDPAAEAGADGLFRGALVPQMATMGSEGWEITVDVTPEGGAKTEVALGVVPIASGGLVKVVMQGSGMDAKRYVVAADFPAAPKVGDNAVDVWVFGMSQDMMAFPASSDATLKMTPEMPSHGHGSPGNVDPTHAGGGRYRGSVNFSMPGEWTITLGLSVAGQKVGDVVFTLTI